jgi:hypothetical protein
VYDVDVGEQNSIRGITSVGGGAIVTGFDEGHLGDAGQEGWVIIGEADVSSACQHEEVWLVQVRTGAEESHYMCFDAPSVQRHPSLLLEKGDRGNDGVREGRVENVNECVSLIVR